MDDGVSPAGEWEPYTKQLAKSRNREKVEFGDNYATFKNVTKVQRDFRLLTYRLSAQTVGSRTSPSQ